MIDLHSHILPQLDDGARDLEESLAMARLAVESGVSHMLATPHCMEGGARTVTEAVMYLQQALQTMQIPLKVLPGMEIFGTRDTARLLREGRLLTLNGSRYPLIEFDFEGDGYQQTAILEQVRREGYIPVVAHPERYVFIQRQPQILNTWVQLGCLLQINKGSLTGRFGHTAQDLAMALVGRGFAAVVASDAHSARYRTPWIYDAWQTLAHQISPLAAEHLLLENPRKLLNDTPIRTQTPDWFE